MLPILEALRKDYKGRLVVEMIDFYKFPAVKDLYGIRGIPTQILFDAEDNEVWRHEGAIERKDLVAKLAKVGVK